MLKRNNLDKINDIQKEIEQEYLNTGSTPWIIGYSGGKDSTTVLQLMVEVLLELKAKNKAKKMVYVISSDTLVENPLVLSKTKRSIDNINSFAISEGIPLKAEMIYPKFNNTFFVKLIGSGYPAPIQSFRWCTDRIKIFPANEYIYSKVSENGEVVLLLGTREAESNSRKRSMEKHYIKGSALSLHSSISNAWTYAPIAKMDVNDVWGYLLKNSCPWGDDNNELYTMYSSSSQDGECPLVIDEETKSKQTCGNSRFGCWTCTVVKEDKSLNGFIESGETWLKPFVDYRNYLLEIRDEESKRNLFNRKGRLMKADVKIKDGYAIIPKKFDREKRMIPLDTAVSEEKAHEIIASGDYDLKENPILVKNGSKYYRISHSGFTIETRIELFKKLLDVEKEIRKTLPSYEIIRKEEVESIDEIWKSDGNLDCSAIDIYNDYQTTKLKSSSEYIDFELLSTLCKEENFDLGTIHAVLNDASKVRHLKNRNKNIKSIESKLTTQKLLLRK